MGLNSYQSLEEYSERVQFSAAVKRAKALIAAEYEAKLDRDRCAGPIFAMKAVAGWRDTQQIELHGALANLDLARLAASPGGREMIAEIAAGRDPLQVLAAAAQKALPAPRPEPLPMEIAEPDAQPEDPQGLPTPQ